MNTPRTTRRLRRSFAAITPPGVAFGGSATDCQPDVVTVNLAAPLTAREQISIADTTLEFGVQSDRRPLARSSTSVVSKESRKPTFEIVSSIGQSTITVIAEDAIADAAGNGNLERTSPAPVRPTSLPTVSVQVSNQFHDTQAKYAVPAALTGGNSAVGGGEDVFFTAKPNGRAGGANGNGWTFDFRKASTHNPDEPVSIEVFVNVAGKRAFITFANDRPKFADLSAALRAHSGFNSLWDVSVDNVEGQCAPANEALTVGAAVTASGDQDASADKVRDSNTKMAITATFSGYVSTVHSSEVLTDVFAATVVRVPTATLADSIADGYAADNTDTTDKDESKNPAQPSTRSRPR